MTGRHFRATGLGLAGVTFLASAVADVHAMTDIRLACWIFAGVLAGPQIGYFLLYGLPAMKEPTPMASKCHKSTGSASDNRQGQGKMGSRRPSPRPVGTGAAPRSLPAGQHQ